MPADDLVQSLTAALDAVPLIDPHSHIDPLSPASRSLDDILGYHYYTELAHAAGMPQDVLAAGVSPRGAGAARSSATWTGTTTPPSTAGSSTSPARSWGSTGPTFRPPTRTRCSTRPRRRSPPRTGSGRCFAKTKLEKIFLTNEFDDPLEGFDTDVYVPCLRADTLVFHLDKPDTRARLAKATGVDVHDAGSLRRALATLFMHFTRKGAKACAISLPPSFHPASFDDEHIYEQMTFHGFHDLAPGLFWLVAEFCREFKLPFDLMVGVNRNVYPAGVHQGRDLFDQRTSLIQYKELFNAFPEVTFPVSVLTSAQNQELVAYGWIFPNVRPSGHWWYSNVPPYIRADLTERLSAVPNTKLIGYYSDAYKLEFVLPKYAMYRRVLAGVLADQYVRPGTLTETAAVALGTRLLRDNVKETFRV